MSSVAMLSKEFRFFLYVGGVYLVFIKWGMLQDKLSKHSYECNGVDTKFNSFFLLNLLMAFAAFITASYAELYSVKGPQIPLLKYLKPSVTCALASPLSYFAISNKLISYPLMVLTKSSKPVPVMMIGLLFFKKRYDWFKYVSVLLVCVGITYYTYSEQKGDGQVKATTILGVTLQPLQATLLGIVLVFFNLILDGYTNNDQDKIFSEDKATSIQMMKYTNFWQTIFITVLLLCDWAVWGTASELHKGLYMFGMSSEIRYDIFMFCLCASIGQVLIFAVMEEFGSLTWITVSITRKLFSIVVHDLENPYKKISLYQWLGVLSVFIGLGLEVVMNYSKGLKVQKVPATLPKPLSKSKAEKSTSTARGRSSSPSKTKSSRPKSPSKSKSPRRSKSPARVKKTN